MTVAQIEKRVILLWQQPQKGPEKPMMERVKAHVAGIGDKVITGSILHFAFGRRSNVPDVPPPSRGGGRDEGRKPNQDKKERTCATPSCDGIPVGNNAHCNYCLEAASKRRVSDGHAARTGHYPDGSKPHRKRRFWLTGSP